MDRQVIESKLLATREELSKAGPIHAKDLQKYIHRLEKQLRIMNKVTKERFRWRSTQHPLSKELCGTEY